MSPELHKVGITNKHFYYWFITGVIPFFYVGEPQVKNIGIINRRLYCNNRP